MHIVGGMPPKELLEESALVHSFIENSKQIERIQWKSTDAQGILSRLFVLAQI